jgi:molecular chaperone HscB
MPPQTPAPAFQICKHCAGGAPIDAHFCPQCEKILSLGTHGDYFSFLGVPRKLNLDAAEVERSYRALSRQFHPDYFYNATAAERRASLERSSYLNDAYRTLRNHVARVAYLLQLEGLMARGPEEASKQVPPDLLEEVFALNEQLDEVRALRAGGAPAEEWRRRFELAARPIEAKRVEHEEQLAALSARWDSLVERRGPQVERRAVLEALRDRVLERNYITNLLAGIERELQP